MEIAEYQTATTILSKLDELKRQRDKAVASLAEINNAGPTLRFTLIPSLKTVSEVSLTLTPEDATRLLTLAKEKAEEAIAALELQFANL